MSGSLNVCGVVLGRAVDPSLDSGEWFIQTDDGDSYSLRDLIAPVAAEGERVAQRRSQAERNCARLNRETDEWLAAG